MPSEPASPDSGFLRGQLAEGARPFLARRGVYDLLGMFPREPASLVHPLRIPGYAFHYRSPKPDPQGNVEVTMEFPDRRARALEPGTPGRMAAPAQAPSPSGSRQDLSASAAPPPARPDPVDFPPESRRQADGAIRAAETEGSAAPVKPGVSLHPVSSFSIPGATAAISRFPFPAAPLAPGFLSPSPVPNTQGDAARLPGKVAAAKVASTMAADGARLNRMDRSVSPAGANRPAPIQSGLPPPSASGDPGIPFGGEARPKPRPASMPSPEQAVSGSRRHMETAARFPAFRPSPAAAEEADAPPGRHMPPPPQAQPATAWTAPQPVQRAATAPAFWERSYLSRLHLRRMR